MIKLIFSCEHGGNIVPEEYKFCFKGANDVLKTHKGWDIGILPVAKSTATCFNSQLYFSQVTRLLVELNRSLDNPALFSDYTTGLSEDNKQQILSNYYLPYRNQVENKIKESISEGCRVIHLSFHSFTPIMNNEERACDVGLLFDPERELEKYVCERWKNILDTSGGHLKIMFNNPYQGTDDGFTTYLRTKFENGAYAGIELEINQKYLMNNIGIEKISNLIIDSLQKLIVQVYKEI